MSDLRLYVACLASYNNGILHGAWIDLAGLDADDLKAAVATVLASSPTAGAEEWAIHDHEGFGSLIGEYTDLETVITIAEALAGEHALGFRWLIEARGYKAEDAAAQAEDVNIHQNDERRWDLAVDYAEDFIAETWDLDALPSIIRGNIDFKGIAQELTIAGDIDDHECDGERFLVTNANSF